MIWLTLLGSLAAVFALAAVTWFLGMGKSPRITDAHEAKQLASDAHSGFQPAEAAVSRDGRAALVAGRDGEFVLLRGHGAKIVARVLRTAPQVIQEGTELVIVTGEQLFGDVRLDLGEAEAERLERELTGGNQVPSHG